jgi:hypothetical protein
VTSWETIVLEYRGMEYDLPGLSLVYELVDETGRCRERHELVAGTERLRLRTLNPDVAGGYWKSSCPLPDYMLDPSAPQPDEWLDWVARAAASRREQEHGEVPIAE